ncbi:hypothetical protein Vretimale_11209 [Volvox reticuliferus]|nr:hypothetical protein Vretifemale_12262 [Volvox reticuliferus]GIM06990.1 hypothetical protein Vretimale_11209 [Volvox reticuliferus]
MRLGQQNDAAEALACLCDALDTELAAWYMLYGRWIQSPLLQVCEATTATAAGEDVAEAVHWRNTGILLAAATTSTSPAPAGSQSRHGPGSQRQCPGVKQVAIVGTTQPPPSSSSPPSGCECIHPFVGASSAQLASANPLRGLTATTSTCCLCGGMSAARLEPFWSLQLPLPPPPPPSCSSSSRAVPACSATGGPASARLHHYRHRLHGAMAATAIGSGVESVGMLGRRRPLLPSLDPDALGAVTAVPSGMQQQQQQQSHPVLPATTTRPALGAAPASSERDGGAPSGGSLALADCLELAVQAEEVEGVDCCRCSLLAAVRRVRAIVRTKGPGTAAHSATVPPPSQYTILDPDLDPAPDQGLEAGTATGAGTSCRHSSLGPDGRGDCLSAEECMGLTTPEADDQSMQVTEGSTMAGVKRQSVGPGMANGGAVTTATASFQLEQQLMRLEDMLSGPHLPDLDLDIELKGLTELIAQQQQQWRRLQQLSGGVCAAAVAAPAAALTPVRARALRRTRVVSCPPVLVLQLLRTVWDSRTGLTAKDGRHVAFPVELGPRELALLGAAAAVATRPQHEEEQEEEKQGGSVARDENEPALCVIGDGKKWVPEVKGGSLPTAVPSPPPPAYTLTAVVVHYGSPESGHYLMYRRISTLLRREEVSRNCGAPAAATATASATDTATAAAATAAGGTGEHNSCISEYSCSCAWLRVSDSSVMLADEGEVLQQSAAVLLYEMQ